MDNLIPKTRERRTASPPPAFVPAQKIPVRLLVPNFFTVLSLCAGLTAIRMAIELRFEMAIALVVVAALLDGVDGRVARLLKAQSKFGAELDSLADFVNSAWLPRSSSSSGGLGPSRAQAGSSRSPSHWRWVCGLPASTR